jgi:hypothetical protein
MCFVFISTHPLNAFRLKLIVENKQKTNIEICIYVYIYIYITRPKIRKQDTEDENMFGYFLSLIENTVLIYIYTNIYRLEVIKRKRSFFSN